MSVVEDIAILLDRVNLSFFVNSFLGVGEVIGKRLSFLINNDFSMAEKRETGGVLAWQSLQ